MKRFLKLYFIEQKIFFRSFDVFIFNLCMPVITLIVIMMVSRNDLSYLNNSFASLSTVGICCSGLMSIPIVLVEKRDKKILKQYYCTSCPLSWFLAVDVLCSFVLSVLSMLLVALCAKFLYGYHMYGNLLGFALVWLLTTFCIYSIGLMIASVCKSVKSMNVVTSLVYFPFIFLSGAMIPFELFPDFLQKIASVMPLTLAIKLLKATSIGYSINSIFIVLYLVIISIICSVIAYKTFRWE